MYICSTIMTNSVILQVVLNSRNNEIIGLAMTSDQLSSLHVFREVDEGFRTNNTSYASVHVEGSLQNLTSLVPTLQLKNLWRQNSLLHACLNHYISL